MTIWINAGAKRWNCSSELENLPTKAALKRALKSEPQRIVFDTTGNFPKAEERVVASDLGNRPRHADEAWQICGPDPHNDRRWYATVTVNRLGNLVVK